MLLPAYSGIATSDAAQAKLSQPVPVASGPAALRARRPRQASRRPARRPRRRQPPEPASKAAEPRTRARRRTPARERRAARRATSRDRATFRGRPGARPTGFVRPGRHLRWGATLVGGGVSERPKEHASKACVGATPPWVRIPPPPRGVSGESRGPELVKLLVPWLGWGVSPFRGAYALARDRASSRGRGRRAPMNTRQGLHPPAACPKSSVQEDCTPRRHYRGRRAAGPVPVRRRPGLRGV